ncbi:MAG: response regulator [Chloroflexi bacterium]|nr:response regulator [Chloroflexota bacterium]
MAEQGTGRKRIAVVNDDTAFLDLMYDLLEDLEGYEVLICRESDQVPDFIKRAQPDLVILDIVMGREEAGWSVLNLLTLDPATRPIPVLVCSAAVQSLRDHADVLRSMGIETIPKPFDLDALLAAIERTLARHTPGNG